MHFSRKNYHSKVDTVGLDCNFLSRLRGNTLTFNDVEKLLTMGSSRLSIVMRAYGGVLCPQTNVYHYMVQEIPHAPTLKIVYILPYLEKHIWMDILDNLGEKAIHTLLEVVYKLSLQSKYKQDMMTIKYLEIIVYGMNIILVKYLAGHYRLKDIIDTVGDIAFRQNLKELRPMLYKNLNEVFNLQRWHNKQKLLNKM